MMVLYCMPVRLYGLSQFIDDCSVMRYRLYYRTLLSNRANLSHPLSPTVLHLQFHNHITVVITKTRSQMSLQLV